MKSVAKKANAPLSPYPDAEALLSGLGFVPLQDGAGAWHFLAGDLAKAQ